MQRTPRTSIERLTRELRWERKTFGTRTAIRGRSVPLQEEEQHRDHETTSAVPDRCRRIPPEYRAAASTRLSSFEPQRCPFQGRYLRAGQSLRFPVAGFHE